jgi:hypothetical protein
LLVRQYMGLQCLSVEFSGEKRTLRSPED